MSDSDGDNSVLIGSKIDSFLIENEDFRIRISVETFLNNCSSKHQSVWSLPSFLFQQFCFCADNLDSDGRLSETPSVFLCRRI
jgi:hypothetical protein